MATSSAVTGATWETLATHDWGATEGIESTLVTALDTLTEGEFTETLYDYIDLDAVLRVLDPGDIEHGASEVRFEYNGHDVRITNEGRIQARE
jgi:hypothetical protein